MLEFEGGATLRELALFGNGCLKVNRISLRTLKLCRSKNFLAAGFFVEISPPPALILETQKMSNDMKN